MIATNESYKEIAQRRGGLAPEDVVVVRSGPETGRFVGLHAGSRAQARTAVPRRLPRRHGAAGRRRLPAARRRRCCSSAAARATSSFTLIGAGDSYDDLVRLTKELGLEDVVEFTGRIPDADVEAILSTADVCVGPDPKNPLNDVSTMNKILEYMALGRPIVAFDLRETRYSAGEGALYARPNEVDDLAARIEELLRRSRAAGGDGGVQSPPVPERHGLGLQPGPPARGL